jgi:hypothetical protein
MGEALQPVLRGAVELAVAQRVLLLVLLMAQIGQRIEAQLQQQSDAWSGKRAGQKPTSSSLDQSLPTHPMRSVLGVVILNKLQVVQPDAETVLHNLHKRAQTTMSQGPEARQQARQAPDTAVP